MRTRCGCALMIGLVLVGLLSGCATTISRQDTGGLSNGISTAENPEYLAHPFRLVALPLHAAGNILRYTVVEPFYFLMNTVPDFVGLSLEEREYLQERQDAWARAHAEAFANPKVPVK